MHLWISILKGLSSMQTPNCLQCKFFKVTWDPHFPRSCLLFRVKSRELPGIVVARSTGKSCPAFEKSAGIKKNEERGK